MVTYTFSDGRVEELEIRAYIDLDADIDLDYVNMLAKLFSPSDELDKENLFSASEVNVAVKGHDRVL